MLRILFWKIYIYRRINVF